MWSFKVKALFYLLNINLNQRRLYARMQKSQNNYPAVEEFNRRYNNLIKLNKDEIYNKFVEETIKTLLNYKESKNEKLN